MFLWTLSPAAEGRMSGQRLCLMELQLPPIWRANLSICCRFSGAEDVVMAFSRSEAEDRRQWPWAPLPPTFTPQCIHLTSPPTPFPHVIHRATPQTRHWWAQERRGRDSTRWLPRSRPPPPPPPTPPSFAAGWNLSREAVNENTHRLWMNIKCSFFLFFSGWVCFVLFCLCWGSGSVTCYMLSLLTGRWRKWAVSS